MNTRIIAAAGVAVLLLSACSSSIPLNAQMSEAIIMNIKTSQTKALSYEYESKVSDGLIIPCNKGTRDELGGHPGYLHSESTTLDGLLSDYLSMKFTSLKNSADTKLKVTLKDFWLEQYSMDGAGKQFLVAFVGGETNVMVVANLVLVCQISKNGASVTKVIRVCGDSAHVAGIGTGTSSGNMHRRNRSIEFRAADAINAVNNKALAMLDQFMESNQL